MSTHFFICPAAWPGTLFYLYIYMIHYFLRLRQYFFRLKKPRPAKRGFILLANRVEIGHNNKDKRGDKK